MSDPVRCDKCGKHGPRRMGKMCPEGWFFIEAPYEDNPADSAIIYACSPECRDNIWQPGPGKLDLGSAHPKESDRAP